MPLVNESLARLREIGPQLNKATDAATQAVLQVENVLTKELSLGLEAEVLVHEASLQTPQKQVTKLVHRRVHGKFRIAVAVEMVPVLSEPIDSETVSETAWVECPRHMKLETFPKLPLLLEALLSKAETAVAHVRKTEATVRELLGLNEGPEVLGMKDIQFLFAEGTEAFQRDSVALFTWMNGKRVSCFVTHDFLTAPETRRISAREAMKLTIARREEIEGKLRDLIMSGAFNGAGEIVL